MLIAETVDVRRAYPQVSPDAVQYLLWALHRAIPELENGRRDDALDGLRGDLAHYTGDLADFERLGVPQIFEAAGQGRTRLAALLAELRLLAVPSKLPRYVIVGDALTARMWARQRAIMPGQVVPVRSDADVPKLHGLGDRVLIVHLDDRPVPNLLDAALSILIAGGAEQRPAAWRPGDRPDPDVATGRRQLHLRD